jgi:malonyl-CoA O-methyltransferase
MPYTINNKIQRGFNGAAKRYDLFSSLQREIADKLLTQVRTETLPSTLLDVGCGTGYLTIKLKEHLPQGKIFGLDLAQEMLKVARSKEDNISWILGDGNDLPFDDGKFDLVISNLSYQWSGDLSRAFAQARRVLVPQGILACTLFGYNTCQELFQCLDEAKTGALQFSRLPDELKVRQALINSGFEAPTVELEEIKIGFKDMYELITWLKSIGANNLSREGFLGSETIAKAAAIYRQKFPYLQGIGATFEVIKVYAKK